MKPTFESADDASQRPSHSGLSGLLAIACVITLVRVAYLVLACPYNLVEDEAQYWLWSRYPEWSYATKGPGIAWAIWGSTFVYGDAEWAVRLPVALLSGVAVFAAGGLTRDLGRAAGVRRPDRLGVAGAVVFALVPFVQMSGVLVTIDGPLIACWSVAAWAAWRAMHLRSGTAWLVLGVAVAVGFLFKYTMLLLVPGVLLHAWVSRSELSLHGRWRPWVVVAGTLAAVGLVPVVVWNAQHDWATVRHLLGHLGLPGGDQPNAVSGEGRRWFEWLPVWPFQLAMMQVGMVGPLVLAAGLGAWWLLKRGSNGVGERVVAGTSSGLSALASSAIRYPIHIATPILVFYAVVAYIAEPEGNWPIAGSVTLVPLAVLVAGLAGRMSSRFSRVWTKRLVALGIVYGVLAITALHRTDWVAAAVNRVMFWGPVSRTLASMRSDGQPPRPIVTGRLIGAQAMGQAVGRAMAEARAATGGEPFVIAQHYGRASQMAYYAPWPTDAAGGHSRESLCASAYTGGRKTAFDYIEELRLDRAELLGRPAVLLSNDSADMLAQWKRMFETVVPYTPPDGARQLPGEHKKDRVAYLGFGFKGPGATAR